MRLLPVLGVVLLAASQLMAQNAACSEASIKSAISKHHDDPSVMPDVTYFFSGALDKPLVG